MSSKNRSSTTAVCTNLTVSSFLRSCVAGFLAAVLVASTGTLPSIAGDSRSERGDETPSSIPGDIETDPNPSPNDDHGEEDEPQEDECGPWDGERVWCDIIDGTIYVSGTSDDEQIFIEVPLPQSEAEFENWEFKITVLVTYTDGVSELFEFDETAILASAGIFSIEDVPDDFDVNFSIKTHCGDDVVVNTTGFDVYAELGAGDDRYSGDNGVDVVFGQSGDDVIFGGRSQDEISGGSGGDILNGGAAAENVFLWPGVFSWNQFLLNQYGVYKDSHADIIDCGKDADKDWVFAEPIADHPHGVLFDSVINRDWNSPVDTDVVNP